MKNTIITLVMLYLMVFPVYSAEFVLFDGSLNGGNDTLSDQAFNLSGSSSYHSASGGISTYDTTGNNSIGFYYYKQLSQQLDRSTGVQLSFRMKVNNVIYHQDRSGLYMTFTTKDSYGIFFSFYNNGVAAQNNNSTYTWGESSTYSNQKFIDYDVKVLGTGYTLYADGEQILTGSLRNPVHHNWPNAASPNSVMMGDGTSWSGASISFTKVSVYDTIPTTVSVPEPANIFLFATVLIAVFVYKK